MEKTPTYSGKHIKRLLQQPNKSLWSPVHKDSQCIWNALCSEAVFSPFSDALWNNFFGRRTVLLLFSFHTGFVVVPEQQIRVGKQCWQLALTEDDRKPNQWQIWRTTKQDSSRVHSVIFWSHYCLCFKQLLSFHLHSFRAYKAQRKGETALTFLTVEEYNERILI